MRSASTNACTVNGRSNNWLTFSNTLACIQVRQFTQLTDLFSHSIYSVNFYLPADFNPWVFYLSSSAFFGTGTAHHHIFYCNFKFNSLLPDKVSRKKQHEYQVFFFYKKSTVVKCSTTYRFELLQYM